jgi:hypothetical protein
MHLYREMKLTAASNGPPDQRLSRFKFTVSAPGGPNGIAPRRPLPSGYAVRIMSLEFAGALAHNDFAIEGRIRDGKRRKVRGDIFRRVSVGDHIVERDRHGIAGIHV